MRFSKYDTQETKIKKIEKDIERAKFNCLTLNELIELLKISSFSIFNHCENILNRIGDYIYLKKYTDIQIEYLISLVERTIKEGEEIPSKYRYKSDSLLKKLLRILPSEISYKYAMSCFKHRRKARREVGFNYFKRNSQCKESINKLLELYRETFDKRILELIARNYKVGFLEPKDLNFVLSEIEEGYWRTRIIEVLIEGVLEENTIKIINQYPYDSTYAMGRLEDDSILPIIIDSFESFASDLESIGLVFWALGKVGAKDEINKLAKMFYQCYPVEEIRK
ncbi:hypothetical protein [Facklamia sp. P9177]|uniref:hypothetical protein n=1 Tax=Facklamia sp. P9177 TaxID=3421945 RepID=UPI003D1817C4